MAVLTSLIFIFFAIFLGWCYEIYRKNKMLRKIPGPLCIPFIGFTDIPTDVYGITIMINNLFQKYGKTVKLYFGDSLQVLTCDADLIEAVMKSDHIKKSKLYDLGRPWLGDGILTSSGKKWELRRKYLTQSFHFAILKEFLPMFKEHSDILVKKLGEVADGKTVINAVEFVAKLTLDVISETSLGVKLGCQDGFGIEYLEAVDRFVEITLIRNLSPWKRFNLPFRLFAPEYEDHKTALEILNNTAKNIIKQKRENLNNSNKSNEAIESGSKKKVNLIDALLLHSELNDEDILEEVNTFMFAGFDTTSVALSFALYELSQHQDIQEKLYNEIIQNEENLSQESIQKMKYLDQVVRETLRSRSPVPLIDRELQEDAKLGDIVYPKGTTISMQLYFIHHQQDYYSNPENFVPERFNPDNQLTRPTFAFVPFSAGLRNCIGQKFGLLELKVALTKVIKEYHLKPVDGPKIIIGIAGTLRSKNGLPIILERRKK